MPYIVASNTKKSLILNHGNHLWSVCDDPNFLKLFFLAQEHGFH